jgi:flagellar basal-body rod protein FlgC
MFDALDIPASGLLAQRARMDAIVANVANIDTVANEKNENIPYRRRFVVFSPGQPGNTEKPGVHLKEVGVDQSPFRMVYDPGHRFADKDGYVKYPNVDLAIEQVNMIEASRAYEANITMMDTLKGMINSTLRLLA